MFNVSLLPIFIFWFCYLPRFSFDYVNLWLSSICKDWLSFGYMWNFWKLFHFVFWFTCNFLYTVTTGIWWVFTCANCKVNINYSWKHVGWKSFMSWLVKQDAHVYKQINYLRTSKTPTTHVHKHVSTHAQ